jgi:DNA-binding NarL/FixJ family response regulator
LLTRAEKERLVIGLYEEGKTYREIAKEVHMSSGDISSIIKRHVGEPPADPEKDKQQQQEQTIDTKVFKLLDEGKTPIQVAITLNLPSAEVTRLHTEYRKLIGLQELNQLHKEIGDDIFEFHRTYKFIKGHGYVPSQLIEAAGHLVELPLLRSEREQLIQENQNLEKQKENRSIVLEQINENIAIAHQNLDSMNAGIQANAEELERLNRQKLQVQTAIASLNTSAGYQHIIRIAEAAASSILAKNQVVLLAALRALFQALKEEPRNQLQLLIYGSLSYPLYEPGNGRMPQNYLELRQAILLQAAEEMYKDLLAKAVNTTMSSALYTRSGSGYPLN